MTEEEYRKIKEVVGDVVIKTNIVEFEIHKFKGKIEDNKWKSLEEKLKALKENRSKFAHEILLINPKLHPGIIFLSKNRRQPSWIDRQDGERFFELYDEFNSAHDELVGELKQALP